MDTFNNHGLGVVDLRYVPLFRLVPPLPAVSSLFLPADFDHLLPLPRKSVNEMRVPGSQGRGEEGEGARESGVRMPQETAELEEFDEDIGIDRLDVVEKSYDCKGGGRGNQPWKRKKKGILPGRRREERTSATGVVGRATFQCFFERSHGSMLERIRKRREQLCSLLKKAKYTEVGAQPGLW